jgi:hypothetical protein
MTRSVQGAFRNEPRPPGHYLTKFCTSVLSLLKRSHTNPSFPVHTLEQATTRDLLKLYIYLTTFKAVFDKCHCLNTENRHVKLGSAEHDYTSKACRRVNLKQIDLMTLV